jgi:hypothetical protein
MIYLLHLNKKHSIYQHRANYLNLIPVKKTHTGKSKSAQSC